MDPETCLVQEAWPGYNDNYVAGHLLLNPISLSFSQFCLSDLVFLNYAPLRFFETRGRPNSRFYWVNLV